MSPPLRRGPRYPMRIPRPRSVLHGVNYRSTMARSRSSYNPLASSSCANFLERRQHELRRINLPRTPLNRGEKKAHEVLCKRQLEGGGLETIGAGNKSTVVRGKRETIRW